MHFFLPLLWKICLKFLNPSPYLVGLLGRTPHTHTQGWASLGSVAGKIPQLRGAWAPLRLSVWFQADSCQVKGLMLFLI